MAERKTKRARPSLAEKAKRETEARRLLDCSSGELALLRHFLRCVRTAVRTGEQLQIVVDPHLGRFAGEADYTVCWSASGWQFEAEGLRRGTARDAKAASRKTEVTHG